MARESGEDLERAVDLFKSAIVADPNYALAYAGLALCYFHLWVWDYLPPEKTLVDAETAALKAVEMDEDLGAAHYTLGFLNLFYKWDWGGAQKSLLKGIQLSPGDEFSYGAYAWYLAALGDMDQAIETCGRALEVDPLSPAVNTCMGMLLLRAGLSEQAIKQFRETLELQPDQPQAHWLLGQALVLVGRHQEGIQEIEGALTLSRTSMDLAALGWAYGIAGREQDARRVLRTLQERSRKEYVRPYVFAKVHCGLGDPDTAFDWLDKACRERDSKLAFIKTDETMASLRSDPRFGALLRKMGFPEMGGRN
jgi:tetratricopeptide (TPR) repeat protein